MIKHKASSIRHLLLLTYILFICQLQKTTSTPAKPCKYSDTVDLTDNYLLSDNTYLFEGLKIPANLTAEYEHEEFDGRIYSTQSHLRGCICLVKPCIRFCCLRNMYYDEKYRTCMRIKEKSFDERSTIKVKSPNGGSVLAIKKETFVERFEYGCEQKSVESYRSKFWEWNLLENGTIQRDGKYYLSDEYCFAYLQHSAGWTLVPLTCARFERDWWTWLYIICMSLAIIINFTIFILYIYIDDLRKSHYGKGLLFHLGLLIVGLGGLVLIHFINPWDFSDTACRNIGLGTYLFILLAILVMNITSINLCVTFVQSPLRGWYLKSLYCLILLLAGGILFYVIYMQDPNIKEYLRPGIGDYYCWFNLHLEGVLILYYLPTLSLICLGVLSLMVALEYLKGLCEVNNTVGGEDCLTVFKHLKHYFMYELALGFEIILENMTYFAAHSNEYNYNIASGVFYLILAVTAYQLLVVHNIYVKNWRSATINIADIPVVHNDPPPNCFELQLQHQPGADPVSDTEEDVL